MHGHRDHCLYYIHHHVENAEAAAVSVRLLVDWKVFLMLLLLLLMLWVVFVMLGINHPNRPGPDRQDLLLNRRHHFLQSAHPSVSVVTGCISQAYWKSVCWSTAEVLCAAL